MSGTAIQNVVASDTQADRSARAFAIRLTVTTLAVVIWFWTQSLIGARGMPGAVIGDRLHGATAR